MHRGAIGKLKRVAEAIYRKRPQASEANPFLAALGNAEIIVEAFPENWPVIQLFMSLCTQWNVGMQGRTGLNHLVVLARIDRMKLSDEEANQMFDDIFVMELAALEEMNRGED